MTGDGEGSGEVSRDEELGWEEVESVGVVKKTNI
jgi:hypothetical protein